MKKCGGCAYGKLVPQDMTKRFCNGLPPAPVAVPGRDQSGKTGIQIQMVRPVVGATDDGCALWAKHTSIETVVSNVQGQG